MICSAENDLINPLEELCNQQGLMVIRVVSAGLALMNVATMIPGVAEGQKAVLIADQGNVYFYPGDWGISNSFRFKQSVCPMKSPSPANPPSTITEFLEQVKNKAGSRPILFLDSGTSTLPDDWFGDVPVVKTPWPVAGVPPTIWACCQL